MQQVLLHQQQNSLQMQQQRLMQMLWALQLLLPRTSLQ
jgi:hypothetical protein